MGLELRVRARYKRQESDGRLHLDSQELNFRGTEFQWSTRIGQGIKAVATNGRLVVRADREQIEFDVGETAEKWVEKILNPPSRLQKLGVKTEMKCWVSSGFDSGFKDELTSNGSLLVKKIAECQLAFFLLTKRSDLTKLVSSVSELPLGVNIWIVWPKGTDAVSQKDVMQTARECGMGPSKTAAFDASHSSLRFALKK